jgi:hypothetical protein
MGCRCRLAVLSSIRPAAANLRGLALVDKGLIYDGPLIFKSLI